VLKGHQHFTGQSVPASPPFLVHPADAERERAGASLHEIVQRPVEQPAAVEPIVVIAKGIHAVSSGQLELLIHGLGQSQIVIAESRRLSRLQVPSPERLRRRNVAPFGETSTPPAIVLGDGMVLRQVKGDDARSPGAASQEQPVEHPLQAPVRAVVSHRLAQVVHGLRIAP
jgi:hypothetical protein